MEFVLLIIGFVLLIKFADLFVGASINIAKIFHVSEIVIGATLVSIGTTLPETIVSAISSVEGHGDISYGNAIGSIICNTSLIAGSSLLFASSKVDKKALKRISIFFFATFTFYAFIAYTFAGFSRWVGIVLLLIFVLYIIVTIKFSNDDNKKGSEDTISFQSNKYLSAVKSILVLAISAAVIAFASNLLIDSGIKIATRFGVSESVIGITIIALGTSLPEFSTAITSIIKGHSSLSIGNIIGANFFNLVTVSGLAITLNPFNIPVTNTIYGYNKSFVIDLPFALMAMLIMCVPPLITGSTKKWQGLLLIILYIAFLRLQF